MKREPVTSRLVLIIKYLNRLREFESVSVDEYLNSFDYQLIAERLIQLLVDVASDINTYILVQLHNIVPSAYYDSFVEAGKKGIVIRELALGLAASAGMRNRLVHQYEVIDNRIVFSAIPIALDQYQLYVQEITSFLDSLEITEHDSI